MIPIGRSLGLNESVQRRDEDVGLLLVARFPAAIRLDVPRRLRTFHFLLKNLLVQENTFGLETSKLK